jgi:WD40 repeat protein
VDDFTAVVWDVVTGKVIRVLAGHVANVLSAGYRADGARIFTFAPADGTVRLWEAASGRTQVVFPGPPGDSIVGAWFHGEEGRLVLGTREGAARIFSTERCRLLAHATAMLPVNLTDSAWAAILDDVPMPARSDTKCPDPGP